MARADTWGTGGASRSRRGSSGRDQPPGSHARSAESYTQSSRRRKCPGTVCLSRISHAGRAPSLQSALGKARPIPRHHTLGNIASQTRHAEPGAQKNPGTYKVPGFSVLKSLAVSYSHTEKLRTTIGAERFHFRVRNGIGWFPLAIAARQTAGLREDHRKGQIRTCS